MSDTDASFVLDVTELRLVPNRNKLELMYLAYKEEDGKWMVNPVFIDPKQAGRPQTLLDRGANASQLRVDPRPRGPRLRILISSSLHQPTSRLDAE